MKPDWKTFLQDAGAELSDERVATFGNPERELQVALTGNVLSDLSHHGLIGVHGADAKGFLHGQLTNDVGAVDEGRSQLTAYLSPKGRMLAVFRLFVRGDHYYLRLPRELVDPTLQRLRMFVMRANVNLEDASDDLVRLGCSGPQTADELAAVIGPVPEAIDEVTQTEGLTLLRVPGAGHPRFEVYGYLEPMKRLWDALNVRGAPVGADAWALLEIRAGLPAVYPATVDAFVPQMANLDRVGGVSFNKGCYPGQEVVARMHYLGNLKRRMYRAWVSTSEAPPPGAEVYPPDGDQAAGIVVDARPSPDGGHELLAVLQIAAARDSELHLADAERTPLELRDLPYEVTAPEAGSV